MGPVYAWLDSKISQFKGGNILFLDCGSNLGQGYEWFSKYFNSTLVEFEMFEPNPNCADLLRTKQYVSSGRVKLHQIGVGLKSEKVKFYGLQNEEGGSLSQGGSIIKNHNSNYYSAKDENSIEVDILDFRKFLYKKRHDYSSIVVKMDIEGAEVDLLEQMLLDDSIDLIDILYVEFHSEYQNNSQRIETAAREEGIIEKIKMRKKTKLRIWH